jgi:glycosyltransferase involved in cell wall biosynthesis
MTANNSPYILWLPSWYPNKLAPYDGDFIQRHAEATSAFIPIHVVYLVKDKEKRITASVFVEQKQNGNLFETIIYYSSSRFLFGVAGKLLSLCTYRKLYKKFIHELLLSRGMPALVHVHIAFKAGMIANWLKKKYGIPFLLSEHWTIYLSEAQPNLSKVSFLKRHFISRSIRRASGIIAVSDYLGRSIKDRWPFVNYKVIPNVINTAIFYPGEKQEDRYRLLHISNLGYQKDPENLFDAVKIVKDKGIEFSLEVFGASAAFLKSFVGDQKLSDVVKVHEEVPQKILAQHLRHADLLILYSRYETFGCVVIEANACGVPAIVADIPVMRELVIQNQNGILVKPGSAEALADAVIAILKKEKKFDKEKIAAAAVKYSYSNVGTMLFDEYLPFLTRDTFVRT